MKSAGFGGLAATAFAAASALWGAPPAPQQLTADFGWKFIISDPAGAEAVGFDDSRWRTVDLPHDWSIEGTPDSKSISGQGEGYFPAGVGWYRKAFTAPAEWRGKRVVVEFDGVYMDSTVYLNGQKVGARTSGYSGFECELTGLLKLSAQNVLAVRVDNSAQPNSRWYSGSGIYRHVRVRVTEPVHVPRWGVFVTTPAVAADKAQVSVRTRVKNDTLGSADAVVQTIITEPGGAQVGTVKSPLTVAAGADAEVAQTVAVADPALWSPQTPNLYRAVTQVVSDGKVMDEVVTPFGIRSIAWSVEKGFVLNGKPIKLTGGSVHHDNGALGAAALDRAEERKVKLLKAAGFNAVRTAHNIPSPGFLDACDRLGLLVVDEPFDVWTVSKVKFDYHRFFEEWWQRDMEAMVLRDRNHPSVVIWGIGNEIPEVWRKKGAPIAAKLASLVRKLDGTRPLTQAFTGATFGEGPDSVFALLDIGGYNYNLVANGAKDHARLPSRIMMTTESFPAESFEEWEMVTTNPHVLGEFVWTAMDYLGESGIGGWSFETPEQAAKALVVQQFIHKVIGRLGVDPENPYVDPENPIPPGVSTAELGSVMAQGYPWHASYCGELDLTGFRKPQSYYRDILWNGGDRVFATVHLPEPPGKKTVAVGWAVLPTIPSWTWPGQEGRELQVDVYSGTEKVRLFLNEKLVGEMPTGREQRFKAVFKAPYAPGTLRAVGLKGDRVVAQSVLPTTGAPARLRLTADRAVVNADGQDLSFITVEALDEKGRFQPNADQLVTFKLSGPGVIAAVGSGDSKSAEPYQGNQRRLFNGRAQVVVRSSKTPGVIGLTATAPGLAKANQRIEAQSAALQPELR